MRLPFLSLARVINFPRQPIYFLILLIPLILVVLGNCQTTSDQDKYGASGNNSQPGTANQQIQYAEGFSLRSLDTATLLNIYNPFSDQGDTLRYILLREDEKIPDGLDGDIMRINTPVNNIIGLSATHIGFLKALNSLKVLQGVSDTSYVFDASVRKRVAAGKIKQVGEDVSLNRELILSMEPGLLMASGFPQGRIKKFNTLQEAGIPVIFNSEWMEKTPLARAEWVKVMGALLDREPLARTIFDSVATKYNQLKERSGALEQKPRVIVGLPFKDAWYVSGGNSYGARFLMDAGAEYPWGDNKKRGSIELGLEAVYPVALEASFWISPGEATSKAAILEKDSRIADFKAFQNGNIYNNTRKKIASGGNDYWERGVIHPHLILKDLIKIFHPELLPDYQLTYYEKIR